MSLVTHAIRALTQGVSQQTPSVRLDSQVEDQVNMVSDLAFGLIKRNPVELMSAKDHDGSYDPTSEDFQFAYTDDNGDYLQWGIKKDGSLYRFDNSGSTVAVFNGASAMGYMAHTDINDLQWKDLDDHQGIILNKKIVVQTGANVPTPRTWSQALAWATNVEEGVTYTLTVGAGVTAAVLAGTNETPKGLMTLLGSFLLTNFSGTVKSYTVKNNTLMLDLANFTNYEVDFSNDAGYNTTFSVLEAINLNNTTAALPDAADLPSVIGNTDGVSAHAGLFMARINPTGTEKGSYYLAYNDGVWAETSLDDSGWDSATLPHSIEKYVGGPFLFPTGINLANRGAGDAFSNPSPKFVGRAINHMSYFNGRLTFVSDRDISFSGVIANNQEPINFYRTTTATNLGADRVEMTLDSTTDDVASIQNVYSVGAELFTNTGLSQSVLKTTTDLDLTKSRFSTLTNHTTGIKIPIPIRNSLYFPLETTEFTNFLEFKLDNVSYSGDLITRHCDKYVAGDVLQALYRNGFFIIRTDASKRDIYIQKTEELNGSLVQNAWSKMSFTEDIKFIELKADVLDIIFEDHTNARTLYGSMPLVLSQNIEDTPVQIGYFPYLDFWQRDTVLFPLVNGAISVDEVSGQVLGSSVGATVITGTPFNETSVTLSEIVPREQTENGTSKYGFAKMMLRRIQATLGFTGRMEVQTTKVGRGTTIQKHMPNPTGGIIIGRESVSDTDLKFSVNGRAQDVQIKIVDKGIFTPMNIISMEYQAQIITRGRRY